MLFPIYWLVVTSFKTPYEVDKGPFYIPFVDFQPTLDAWHYILVELGNDTLRPYINTVIVGLSSAVIALILGSLAAYALVRFKYRPARRASSALFIGCIAFTFDRHRARRAPPAIAVASALGDLRHPDPDHRAAIQARPGQQRHRVLDDLAADPAADRGGHPALRALPADRPARQHRRAGHHLRGDQPADRRLADARLLRRLCRVELEESASVDGASIYRIVRSIVLPISVPGLVATFLIVLIFAWNEFLIALVLTSANAQTMPLQVAAQNATRGPQWWAMSVLILIMITPVVVMAILLERYITRGILVGALKG